LFWKTMTVLDVVTSALAMRLAVKVSITTPVP